MYRLQWISACVQGKTNLHRINQHHGVVLWKHFVCGNCSQESHHACRAFFLRYSLHIMNEKHGAPATVVFPSVWSVHPAGSSQHERRYLFESLWHQVWGEACCNASCLVIIKTSKSSSSDMPNKCHVLLPLRELINDLPGRTVTSGLKNLDDAPCFR